MVLTKTKEAVTKPKITQIQLILFAVLMGWLLITNLSYFQNLAVGYQIAAQIAFYVMIMFTAGQKGNIASLVRSLIGIIANGETDETNMLKLQNLVVAMCQELGLLYEQEREKFFNYLLDSNTNSLDVEAEKARLQAEINKLEEVNKSVPESET